MAIASAKKINEDTFGGYTRGFYDGANAVLKEIEHVLETSKLYSDLSTKTRLYEDLLCKCNELKEE